MLGQSSFLAHTSCEKWARGAREISVESEAHPVAKNAKLIEQQIRVGLAERLARMRSLLQPKQVSSAYLA